MPLGTILMSLEAAFAEHLWCLVLYQSSYIGLGGEKWIEIDGLGFWKL